MDELNYSKELKGILRDWLYEVFQLYQSSRQFRLGVWLTFVGLLYFPVTTEHVMLTVDNFVEHPVELLTSFAVVIGIAYIGISVLRQYVDWGDLLKPNTEERQQSDFCLYGVFQPFTRLFAAFA